ncbi:ATP synthase subunit C lysine N-methyltransferase isoform X3 [Xenopus laevis]|uniref:ATP synthase subunit C lysine N-methyltransferase isoform X3 n=1 Tax=Xenopus laevis TaxID=8355 RepID=A0A8J0VGG9_XENLA|nr:ATP synthase subunit C lysine N-methyltransferase isoform X3 [Xenopus laevis]
MEDNIDTILLNKTTTFLYNDKPSSWLPSLVTACTVSTYAFWAMFVFPGFRKVPVKLRVFTAVSLGLQCTGYELNPVLLNWAKTLARWRGLSPTQATFLKQNFWEVDLSQYNNVTVFLAPCVMETLEKKLLAELSEGARVIVCRFPFPHWPPTCTEGVGLNQVWAYDVMHLNGSLLHYRKLQPCT